MTGRPISSENRTWGLAVNCHMKCSRPKPATTEFTTQHSAHISLHDRHRQVDVHITNQLDTSVLSETALLLVNKTCNVKDKSQLSQKDELNWPNFCERHYKSPTALSDMQQLTCGISSLLHSVNLILFTLLLVHLILHISPHHGHQLHSHHLSLPPPFTPDLKIISFTNPFLHSHSYSFRTDFTDLNLY